MWSRSKLAPEAHFAVDDQAKHFVCGVAVPKVGWRHDLVCKPVNAVCSKCEQLQVSLRKQHSQRHSYQGNHNPQDDLRGSEFDRLREQLSGLPANVKLQAHSLLRQWSEQTSVGPQAWLSSSRGGALRAIVRKHLGTLAEQQLAGYLLFFKRQYLPRSQFQRPPKRFPELKKHTPKAQRAVTRQFLPTAPTLPFNQKDYEALIERASKWMCRVIAQEVYRSGGREAVEMRIRFEELKASGQYTAPQVSHDYPNRYEDGGAVFAGGWPS